MTCGIYLLVFGAQAVYVGKSINIEKRFSMHMSLLRTGQHTKKLQAAYEELGDPTLKIAKICHKDWLDYMESVYLSGQRLRLLNQVTLALAPSRHVRKGLRNGNIDTNKPMLEYLCRAPNKL